MNATSEHGEAPTFSIIVPTFNRRAMMARALGSVVAQDFQDWECVVVDDASSDGTPEAVEAFTSDPRFRLLRHAQNRGVCAARNTAVAGARGRWMVLLDSDFELKPGGLAALAALCRDAPDDVGNMATTMGWDNGPDTPIPAIDGYLTLDYPSFLRWSESLHIGEFFNCIRREVFDETRFPEGRAYEAGFHLEVVRRWRFAIAKRTVCVAHTDATNRITASPPVARARRLLRDAPEWSRHIEDVLRAHGDAMLAHAPGLFDRYTLLLASLHLLAGRRSDGVAAARRASRGARRTLRTMAIVGLGLVDRRVLALAQGFR